MARTQIELLSPQPIAGQLCAKCSPICNSVIPGARRERFVPSGLDFKEADLLNRRVIPHHETLGAMQTAALNGCHLCSLLWRCAALLDYETVNELYRSYRLVYQLSPNCGPDDGHFMIEVDEAQAREGERRTRHDMTVWIVPKSNPESWMPERPPESLQAWTTASEESFRLARGWLGKCLKDHEMCALKGEKIRNKPSRLLEVHRQGYGLKVRLATKAEYEDGPLEYLTLSHCWGKGATTLLTKENMVIFQGGIALEELPKTFADAILITAELGYRYLWIDSLCIIQDSPEDWANEAAIMSDIYRHCVCMIAALAASGDDQGCFANRPPLGFLALHIQDGDDTLHMSPPSWSTYTTWFTDNRTFRTPLESRAWTLQEAALSPRTLKFGSEFLLWECLEVQASEMDPSMSRTARDFTDLPDKALLSEAMESHKWGRKGVLSRAWGRLSMNYTHRSLTYIKDRWVALSGVARKVSQECGMEFVAGLAVDDIERHLLWIAQEPGKRLRNGAPSWSWLSVDCAAAQDFRQTMVQMKAMDLPICDAGLDQNWLPSEGMFEALSTPVLSPPVFPINIEAPSCKFVLHITVDGKVELKANDNELVLGSRVLPDVVIEKSSDFSVFGLQHSYKVIIRGEESTWVVDALLLRQVSEEPEYFQRIGVGHISIRNSAQKDVMGLEDFGKKRRLTII